MQRSLALTALALVGASVLSGCSSDGSSLLPTTFTTQSITPANTTNSIAVAPMPKVDPACAALASRIDTLRNEGVVDRAEKAAAGKTSTVQVKRASLGQLAELDKLNAEFQSKCSIAPRPMQAQAGVPGSPVAATAAVVSAATPPAKAKAPAAIAPPVPQAQ